MLGLVQRKVKGTKREYRCAVRGQKKGLFLLTYVAKE